MRIKEKLEQRRKKYSSRKRAKLITTIIAMLVSLGFIHKATVPNTDAYFRFIADSEVVTLTVTEDVYKLDTTVDLTSQVNLTVSDDVYKTID
jgi:hypothetical protein